MLDLWNKARGYRKVLISWMMILLIAGCSESEKPLQTLSVNTLAIETTTTPSTSTVLSVDPTWFTDEDLELALSALTTTTLPPETTTTTQPPVRSFSRERNWDAVAQCESGGDWHINTGNGYYGGLQFSLTTWQWIGGPGYPHEHSREVQIHYAEILLTKQSLSAAWPHCGRYL